MRCDSDEIKQRVLREDPHNDLSGPEVLRVIRALKDAF